jgi:predicted Rossmann fold nucleotide-binding protein DprA/Smf involved in DNA uptake
MNAPVKTVSNSESKKSREDQYKSEETPLPAVSLNEEESRVLQCITAEPITIEELAYLCRMPIAQLMPVLSMLELYGLVQQMIGRKYIRIG